MQTHLHNAKSFNQIPLFIDKQNTQIEGSNTPTKNAPLAIPNNSERFLFNLESTISSTTKKPLVEVNHGSSQLSSWLTERYLQSNPNVQMAKIKVKSPLQFEVETGLNVPVKDEKQHIQSTRNIKASTKETHEENCNNDCKEIKRIKIENRLLSKVIKNFFPYKKIERPKHHLGTSSPVLEKPQAINQHNFLQFETKNSEKETKNMKFNIFKEVGAVSEQKDVAKKDETFFTMIQELDSIRKNTKPLSRSLKSVLKKMFSRYKRDTDHQDKLILKRPSIFENIRDDISMNSKEPGKPTKNCSQTKYS